MHTLGGMARYLREIDSDLTQFYLLKLRLQLK